MYLEDWIDCDDRWPNVGYEEDEDGPPWWFVLGIIVAVLDTLFVYVSQFVTKKTQWKGEDLQNNLTIWHVRLGTVYMTVWGYVMSWPQKEITELQYLYVNTQFQEITGIVLLILIVFTTIINCGAGGMAEGLYIAQPFNFVGLLVVTVWLGVLKLQQFQPFTFEAFVLQLLLPDFSWVTRFELTFQSIALGYPVVSFFVALINIVEGIIVCALNRFGCLSDNSDF